MVNSFKKQKPNDSVVDRRVLKCQKCENHGKAINGGHNCGDCPHKYCNCVKCVSTHNTNVEIETNEWFRRTLEKQQNDCPQLVSGGTSTQTTQRSQIFDHTFQSTNQDIEGRVLSTNQKHFRFPFFNISDYLNSESSQRRQEKIEKNCEQLLSAGTSTQTIDRCQFSDQTFQSTNQDIEGRVLSSNQKHFRYPFFNIGDHINSESSHQRSSPTIVENNSGDEVPNQANHSTNETIDLPSIEWCPEDSVITVCDNFNELSQQNLSPINVTNNTNTELPNQLISDEVIEREILPSIQTSSGNWFLNSADLSNIFESSQQQNGDENNSTEVVVSRRLIKVFDQNTDQQIEGCVPQSLVLGLEDSYYSNFGDHSNIYEWTQQTLSPTILANSFGDEVSGLLTETTNQRLLSTNEANEGEVWSPLHFNLDDSLFDFWNISSMTDQSLSPTHNNISDEYYSSVEFNDQNN